MKFQKYIIDVGELVSENVSQPAMIRASVYFDSCAAVIEEEACNLQNSVFEILGPNIKPRFVEIKLTYANSFRTISFDPLQNNAFMGVSYENENVSLELFRLHIVDFQPIDGCYFSFMLESGEFLLYPADKQNAVFYLPREEIEVCIQRLEAPLTIESRISRGFSLRCEDELPFNHLLSYFLLKEEIPEDENPFKQFKAESRLISAEDILNLEDPRETCIYGLCEQIDTVKDAYSVLRELQYNISYIALEFNLILNAGFAAITNCRLTFDELFANTTAILRVLTNYNIAELWVLESSAAKALSGQFEEPRTMYLVSKNVTTAFQISNMLAYQVIREQRPTVQLCHGVRLWVQDTVYERDNRMKSDLFKAAIIRRERKAHYSFINGSAERVKEQESTTKSFFGSHKDQRVQYLQRFIPLYCAITNAENEQNTLLRSIAQEEAMRDSNDKKIKKQSDDMFRVEEQRLMEKRKKEIAQMQRIRDLPPGDPQRAQAEEEERVEFMKELMCKSESKQEIKQEEAEEREEERRVLMEEFAKRSEASKAEMQARKENVAEMLREIEISREERLEETENALNDTKEGVDEENMQVKEALLSSQLPSTLLETLPLANQSQPYDEEEYIQQRVEAEIEEENKQYEYVERVERRKLSDEEHYERYLKETEKRRALAESQSIMRKIEPPEPSPISARNTENHQLAVVSQRGREMAMRRLRVHSQMLQERDENRRQRVRGWRPLILE